MTILLARLLGPFLFLLAGWGIVEASRALRGRTLPVRLAYGYLVGVAAVGLFLHAMTQIAGPVLTRPVVLAVFASFSLLLLVAYPRRSRAPFPWAAIAPAAIGTAVSVGLLVAAIGRPIAETSDSISVWNTKARVIRAARTVDAPVIRDVRYQMELPTYPVLMPVTQVAVLEALGLSDDDRGVKPLYAAFFPALLVLVFDAARRRAGSGAAALAALAGALLPQISTEPYGGASGAYSDLPMACFLGGGLLLLFERRPGLRAAALAGVLLAGAVLTKTEGLHLALIGLVVALVVRLPHLLALRREGRLHAASLVSLIPPAAGIAIGGTLLAWWRASIADRMGTNYAGLFSIQALVQGLGQRSWGIFRAITESSVNKWEWGWFWPAAAIAVAAGAAVVRRRLLRPVLLFLPLTLLVPLGGYLVTNWIPENLVAGTWSRFLIQTSAFWLVLLAACVRQAWVPSPPRDAGNR
ncbi:MAG: hypothetical protein ACHQPI_12805 [Thermoanaerobaculia bacterium]